MSVPEFPVDLQRRFEADIVNDRIPRGFKARADAFAARYDVSPEDMRRVLHACHRKGLLEPAGDEFVVLGLLAPQVESLFQHTSRAGLSPTSQVRQVVIEPASEDAARRLDVPAGSPVYRLERTRVVNGEVVANQVNFIPFEVCPGLESDDMTHYSFQMLLDGKYHAVVARVHEEVALRAADEADRKVLGLAEDSPVLIVQRLSLSRTERPLVWADIHIRPDRYRYVASLWPQAARLLDSLQKP